MELALAVASGTPTERGRGEQGAPLSLSPRGGWDWPGKGGDRDGDRLGYWDGSGMQEGPGDWDGMEVVRVLGVGLGWGCRRGQG